MSINLNDFENRQKNILFEKYSDPLQQSLIEKRWTSILNQACRNAGVSWGDLNPSTLKKIETAIQNVVAAVDPKGYQPFPNNGSKRAEELIKHLFYPQPALPVLTFEELSCIFFKLDENLLATVRKEFEAAFSRLYDQIKGQHPELITDSLVNHLLGMYVFLDPQHGARLKLLQKVENSWELIDYTIEKIALTSNPFTSPVYAWGFKPVLDPRANSLLIFRGTTHLSAEGSLMGYMADMTPFHSVGQLIFKQGRHEINRFIESAKGVVHLYGHSLGGALAILTAEHFPDRTIVHAHAAPGKFLGTAKQITGSNLYHESDIFIPTLGVFHSHLKLYKTLTIETDSPSRKHYAAHVLPATGCGPSIILRVEVDKENSRFNRILYTLFHQIVAIPAFLTLIGWAALKFTILKICHIFYRIVNVFQSSDSKG